MDVPAVAGVAFSVCGRDADGRVLAEHDADAVRPVASVGKVLLLCTVADALAGGRIDPREALRRTEDDAVADSGLWQHLRVEALPVADLAVLVGAVSDNLATNVLLRHVGLPAVARTAARFGLRRTGMHDRVRDVRGPDDPPVLATGTARELSGLVHALATDAVLAPEAGALVRGWLATGTDTSMAAGALGLDPLAHPAEHLWHKTGTDAGVRADVGHVGAGAGARSYAVLAQWDPAGPVAAVDVLDALRAVGAALLRPPRPREPRAR